jgi:hypothetical protein
VGGQRDWKSGVREFRGRRRRVARHGRTLASVPARLEQQGIHVGGEVEGRAEADTGKAAALDHQLA